MDGKFSRQRCLDPDPVCPERLDPDPVNIRPDPKPCCSLPLNPRFPKLFILADPCGIDCPAGWHNFSSQDNFCFFLDNFYSRINSWDNF